MNAGRPGVDVASLRSALAVDFETRGDPVRADEIDLEVGDAVGEWHPFRAGTGRGEHSSWRSGVVGPDGALVIGAGSALEELVTHWSARGSRPDPRRFAEAAAILYDPAARHDVVLTEADVARYRSGAGGVAVPASCDDDSGWGVAFWWIGRSGATEIRVRVKPTGEVVLTESD